MHTLAQNNMLDPDVIVEVSVIHPDEPHLYPPHMQQVLSKSPKREGDVAVILRLYNYGNIVYQWCDPDKIPKVGDPYEEFSPIVTIQTVGVESYRNDALAYRAVTTSLRQDEFIRVLLNHIAKLIDDLLKKEMRSPCYFFKSETLDEVRLRDYEKASEKALKSLNENMKEIMRIANLQAKINAGRADKP